jgi:hypothetical protein
MYGNPFDEEIRKLTDKELVRMIFNDPENFNPLAINAAKNELEARGLNNDATTRIRENNLSSKFNEIENYRSFWVVN